MKLKHFLLSFGLLFTVAFGVDQVTLGDSHTVVAAKKNSPTCSLKEFKAIKTGMTLTKVRSIIGSKGKLISETSIGGYTSKMYEFKGNTQFSSVMITFMNGKVEGKSQVGLK